MRVRHLSSESGTRLKRRAAMALFGGAAGWALAARAQAMPVIGYLGSETQERYASRLEAFRQGLAEAGYSEGRNVAIEYRWGEGRYNQLPALAKELAARNPAVIVAAGGAEVALAAKAATSTIPIVFEMGGDPIALGVVSEPLAARRQSHRRVEPQRRGLAQAPGIHARGASRRQQVCRRHQPDEPDLGRATRRTCRRRRRPRRRAGRPECQHRAASSTACSPRVRESGAGGLVFSSDPYFAYRSPQLAALSVRHAVPAITQSRDFPLAGGLMSYGGDFSQSHRQSGLYAGRILKGEKPAELPVQRVTGSSCSST